MNRNHCLFLLLCLFCTGAFAQQNDTLKKKLPKVVFGFDDELELKGTTIRGQSDSLIERDLVVSGYVSTYYAWYDDELKPNGFAQFPTLAPRKNQFSLNMALLQVHYNNYQWRSTISLHYGDVPESSWPRVFNLLQEAHAGFKIVRRLWFDAGFFKTHVGLESFQPRENIASSMSIPNFYDPYFFSGAKLTFNASSKLILQAGVFNGYNEYLDDNSDKAVTLTLNYNPIDHISITYNVLTCDETPDWNRYRHRRLYNNLFATFIYNRFTLGTDLNFGIQQHSDLNDSTRSAQLFGAVLVGKYEITRMFDVYARGEYFSDPNKILTGALNTGNFIQGVTVGGEIKPLKTVRLNFEWRILQCDTRIFQRDQRPTNQRNEFIFGLDVWF
jgi:hypothetical protein